ncbi:hypothetical protein GGR58DRAFT_483013 [Xylaria digitata]|nr:hypothetical protein GGR58DRAFT_483013 [Xylaria digitata]
MSLESLVLVEATAKKPLEPIESGRVSDHEHHITKCCLVVPGSEVLGLSLNASSRHLVTQRFSTRRHPKSFQPLLHVFRSAGGKTLETLLFFNLPFQHICFTLMKLVPYS